MSVIIGNPNFHSRKKTIPKMRTIQNRRPLSGVTRFIRYLNKARRQTMIPKRDAPSIIPAAMMRVVRIVPAASG